MPKTQAAPRYARLAEIVRVVERFEDHSLAREAWNHEAHLTVSLWYMLRYDEALATSRIIDGIRAYNRARSIRQTHAGGYHETITLFWLAITLRFLKRTTRDMSELELFNRFLDSDDTRPDRIEEYYSKARISSWRARQVWVEPDLRAFDD